MADSTRMKYSIDHKTSYQYVAPVVQSHHVLHLSPRKVPHQKILGHSLIIEPAPASRKDYLDFNGNPASIIIIEQEHAHIKFHTHSEIELLHQIPQSQPQSPGWEEVSTALKQSLDLELLKFTGHSRHAIFDQEILNYAITSFPPKRPVDDAVMELTGRIFTDFTFDSTATDVSTSITEVMKMKRGVCQDFAHLQIACLRAMGLAARYVSGYILTRPPEGQKKLAGTDATHAWVSVWLGPALGWVDYDPTNNLIPTTEHITFAYGVDYDDVSPIGGVLIGGGKHSVAVSVDVRQL